MRDLVESRSGRRPAGPIRLLTHLRFFGYCFNPVSFYYCFDVAGERIEHMVAEVNNAPWGEQHCYVLSEPRIPLIGTLLVYQTAKAHVSPFMPMELDYDRHFSAPGEEQRVHVALHDDSRLDIKVFDATMRLRRAPLSGWRRRCCVSR